VFEMLNFLPLCSLAQVSLLGMAMGPYVDSQWGLAQFSLPNESPCVCAFTGDRNSVVGESFISCYVFFLAYWWYMLHTPFSYLYWWIITQVWLQHRWKLLQGILWCVLEHWRQSDVMYYIAMYDFIISCFVCSNISLLSW